MEEMDRLKMNLDKHWAKSGTNASYIVENKHKYNNYCPQKRFVNNPAFCQSKE